MKYRTRTYYTDAQKALMWERWKEGWTLHQIAQLFNRRTHVGAGDPVPDGRHSTAGTVPLRNGADAGRERRDLTRHGGWPIDSLDRCCGSGERHQQSAASSSAMVVKRTIEPPKQTTLLGIVRFVRSAANWSRTGRWRASWPTSFGCCGRRNKSPDGSSILIRATRASTCHTRPSTAASSFRRVVP